MPPPSRLAALLFSGLIAGASVTLPARAADPGDDRPAVALQRLAGGLQAPLEVAAPAGDPRLYIAEQRGTIRVLEADGRLAPEPWLDLRERIIPLEQGFEERGLLGFALHPRFATQRRLYVTYTAPLGADAPAGWNSTRRVVELTAPEDPGATVPLASERVLLSVDWPTRKHNGGGLAFGPDGMLYIGLGDGGGAHGVGPRVLWSAFEVQPAQIHWDRMAQDLSTLFGKILRIDVDRGFPGYGIPADNPFVGRQGRPEIFAWGFRNPYRFSFDPDGDGEFFVASVAETLWEAVYRVDGPGNFGWPIREGTHCVNRLRPREPLQSCARHGPDGSRIREPVVEYPNMQIMHPETRIEGTGVGTALVGARLYRGTRIDALRGRLVFADWSADFRRPSGQLFVARPPSRWGALWTFERLLELDTRIIGLAEDHDGEILVLTHDGLGPEGDSGQVFRLVPKAD